MMHTVCSAREVITDSVWFPIQKESFVIWVRASVREDCPFRLFWAYVFTQHVPTDFISSTRLNDAETAETGARDYGLFLLSKIISSVIPLSTMVIRTRLNICESTQTRKYSLRLNVSLIFQVWIVCWWLHCFVSGTSFKLSNPVMCQQMREYFVF